MLRVFLFLLVASLASCADVFFNNNQMDLPKAGTSLGTFPWSFCHSYCTFSGEYEFMRDWEEADPDFVADTQIFDWSYDGGWEFWESLDCGDVIEFYRYGPQILNIKQEYPTKEQLDNCRPAWIYIEQVEIEYVRSMGHFHWTHHINEAYQPTVAAWDEWATRAYNAKFPSIVAALTDPDYDSFDNLLRYFPDLRDADLVDDYDNKFYYRESYIANYEPNFCSMQLPFTVSDTRSWCHGSLIDDTDDVEYPTGYYCDQRGQWLEAESVQYEFGCASEEEDDCDSVHFFSNRAARAQKITPTKTQNLARATRDVRQVAKRDRRSVDIFFNQQDVAGIRFPYCAIRD